MRTKNMEMENETPGNGLQELYIEQLKDLFNAEQQLVKALPKMTKAASSPELKSAFDEHWQKTQEHINRLEKILGDLNEKPGRIKCEGMEGIVSEGEEAIKKKNDDPVIKDAELIAAAQRVEHYEIAGYGTVRTFAEMLGYDDAAELLQQTLEEEGEADKTLTSISEKLLSSRETESEEETGNESENAGRQSETESESEEDETAI